jgi:hypothetical protein
VLLAARDLYRGTATGHDQEVQLRPRERQARLLDVVPADSDGHRAGLGLVDLDQHAALGARDLPGNRPHRDPLEDPQPEHAPLGGEQRLRTGHLARLDGGDLHHLGVGPRQAGNLPPDRPGGLPGVTVTITRHEPSHRTGRGHLRVEVLALWIAASPPPGLHFRGDPGPLTAKGNRQRVPSGRLTLSSSTE